MQYELLDTTGPDAKVDGRRITVVDIVYAVGNENPQDTFNHWELSPGEVTQALEYYLEEPNIDRIESVDEDDIRDQLATQRRLIGPEN